VAVAGHGIGDELHHSCLGSDLWCALHRRLPPSPTAAQA
jgi:hypothetical protein